ncbi:MAG: nucleotidyltransferase domain-containing protein [Prosthecobacter sp.]|uniref:nucleotidyltransferase domain-containing protein n=1 Tax=Prosthecobacter sp. TaxID=1965333 RepID=UPI0038FD70FD
MKLRLENLPESLSGDHEALRQCLEAMDRVMPLREVILFGSHARGDSRIDSDVDLCLVADGADRQLQAAKQYREAIWDVWPRPSFTLVPITPQRLAEKQKIDDPFFETVLSEGVALASAD